ncbi:hypothetical protein ASPZODRAFT_126645 [Penicilliopsis zonata CBS 506.65]|uniref:Putative transcription factor kapC n=1 Tax=Penicilliopsis zonata CBS 506.65 TaxID=1073090 RepID=A0A1L9SUF2_9EURO|nr:hypothetical protein ASPZODRAFT_126645 [Penicilliopsis zonata CBS 506.65]OJJ50717.1 hypothetical protein ASPZODRAFT_126645 [Penicilliopsis zonata CBS 506.65]
MQPALAPAPHPSMQSSAQDHADQVLHDQLLAAQQHLAAHAPARGQGQPPPQHLQPAAPSRDPANNNIDPAIAGTAIMSAPQSVEPDGGQDPKTYGKRPLSTSKRAAQNRAAQRAFRQRKETYIRKLEEQCKEFERINESNKALQAENYQLREYIINLQSRLLDSQGEVPELPSNIDLSQPRQDAQPATTAQGGAAAQTAASAGSPGQAAAGAAASASAAGEDLHSLNRIAVAGLGMRKHPHDEAYLGNGFTKRLRSEEHPGDAEAKQEPPHGLPIVT